MLKTKNVFNKGLVLDLSPENTRNEVLTHALNATLLTFNGNELSLQNDMGNARVETAFLPEGYIPVGTCEYGGIIYIVSYNPLEDKSQIGCFPSPERNVSNEELGVSDVTLGSSDFTNDTGDIINTSKYVLLKNDKLNPGDKFIISTNESIYSEKLANLLKKQVENETMKFVLNDSATLALNIVSIEDSGKINYLNSSLRSYEKEINNETYKYHIVGELTKQPGEKIDIDAYRNVLSSGYNVFKAKTSGKLAILAELIMIDSFSVTHRVEKASDSNNTFNVIISTEVGTEETTEKYNIVPELQYYYLKNSQGTLQMPNVKLFDEDGKFNQALENVKLSEIYTNGSDTTTLDLEDFTFPKPNTYRGQTIGYKPTTEIENELLFSYFTKNKYYRINKNQVLEQGVLKLYYIENFKFYSLETGLEIYTEVSSGELDNKKTYYVQLKTQSYVNAQRDETIRNNSNIKLYVISSDLRPAPDDKINDITIEKFVKRRIVTYRKASQSEIEENVELWEKSEDVYILVISPEEGKEYYIKEETEIWLSIGFEINQEDYTGTIYCSSDVDEYLLASEDVKEIYWDTDKYPIVKEDPHYGCPIILYYRQEVISYKEASEEEKQLFLNGEISLFLQKNYNYVAPELISEITDLMLFLSPILNIYTPKQYFQPNVNDNWIEGNTSPDLVYDQESSIKLFIQSDEVITNLTNDDGSYSDYILATLTLPDEVVLNNADLPFVYDYTIVPCMSYGKLDHLAVSNKVDFSKLHAFDLSKFNTWKYYISNNNLTLTFGAEIYDTFETDKVDGLVLEFYDYRGFSGSLTISDKKSYSGQFTKILPLNTPNTLDTTKIGSENENFSRNVQIIKEIIKGENNAETILYKFNDKLVCYKDGIGWIEGSDSNVTKYTTITSDCGILFSNILYGVKLYFRQSTNDGVKYIYKGSKVLFTLPIYNDYYYRVSDFANLENPEINLAMTYRLEDNSSYGYWDYNKNVTKIDGSVPNDYSFKLEEDDCDTDNICVPKTTYFKNIAIEGYSPTDYVNIQKYSSGTYEEETLSVTRYYQYKGTSKLWVEIGLDKTYEQWNLSYDPDINKYFTCDFNVKGLEPDKNYYTKSELNYNEDIKKELDLLNNNMINYINLKIPKDDSTSKNLSFEEFNFITQSNNRDNYISINYLFIVGHKAEINNITLSEIPVTTICALCHTNDGENYNYEDFGVYVKRILEGDEINEYYLSKAALYNCGTGLKSEFGVAKMKNTKGKSLELLDFTKCYTTSDTNNLYKPLNTGEALKSVLPYIGPLTFCQPHFHEKDELTGPSIYIPSLTTSQEQGYAVIAIPRNGEMYNGGYDSTEGGIVGTKRMFHWPLANMSLNTYNSINYLDEFISTVEIIDSSILYTVRLANINKENNGLHRSYYGPLFAGFDAGLIQDFNKYLVTTMKSVYAYNPDYVTTKISKGLVYIHNENPEFSSYLICSNGTLDSKINLNDYIYFGGVKISDYISDLKDYCDDKTSNTNNKLDIKNTNIQFKANLTKCGSSDMLLTQLTYKTPVPEEYKNELSFDGSDLLVVKHSDGKLSFTSGTINKKQLYGYSQKHNKLVRLSNNYHIDASGKLNLRYTPKNNFFTSGVITSANSINIVKPIIPNITISNESEDSEQVTNGSIPNAVKTLTYEFKNDNHYLLGTNIKLTDLQYEPMEKHRLYVKQGIYTPIPDYKIWYRTIHDGSRPDAGWPADWYYEYYQHNNVLQLYTGPCFYIEPEEFS